VLTLKLVKVNLNTKLTITIHRWQRGYVGIKSCFLSSPSFLSVTIRYWKI